MTNNNNNNNNNKHNNNNTPTLFFSSTRGLCEGHYWLKNDKHALQLN